MTATTSVSRRPWLVAAILSCALALPAGCVGPEGADDEEVDEWEYAVTGSVIPCDWWTNPFLTYCMPGPPPPPPTVCPKDPYWDNLTASQVAAIFGEPHAGGSFLRKCMTTSQDITSSGWFPHFGSSWNGQPAKFVYWQKSF